MFRKAISKVEDSEMIYEQLIRATDSITFKSQFNSFLSSSRAITYALQKDGSKISGFKEWYKKKQEEMKNDELLRFIHEARTEDIHEGKHRLVFATYIQHFSTNHVGTPPEPNAAIGIGADGPFWIVNQGTARERRIPINKGGNYTIKVSIDNPPTSHRGVILFQNDPISICNITLLYLRELVYEAISIFKINLNLIRAGADNT